MLLSITNQMIHDKDDINDRSTKDVTYASGLLPDWNVHVKKSSHDVNISSGGLNDNNADAVNLYLTKNSKHKNSKSLKNVAGTGKRDLLHQNEVCLCCQILT